MTCANNQQCIAQGPATFGSVAAVSAALSQSATPWTNTQTNELILASIPYVVGANPATSIDPVGSVLAMTTDGKYRHFVGNGLPTTPIGNFPVQAGTAAYPYYASLPAGTNPVTGQPYQPNDMSDEIYVAPYNLTSFLPLKPVATGYYPIDSLIVGITLTGGVWHAELAPDSNGQYYSPTNVLPMDACFGHPYSNQYHYHGYSWRCFPNQGTAGHSPLFGYALDGFGIYGPRDTDGVMITNAKLDKCHGHVGPVIDGEGVPTVAYHYHLNREYPFSVGCFRGSVDYYRALGSTDMRETNLPLYSRSAAAAKLKNVQVELNAAFAEKINKTGKGSALLSAVDAKLERAAASLNALDATKDPV